VHQQVILSQEPREQHPMPELVGEFLDELVYGLRLVAPAHVAHLPAPGPEPISLVFLGGVEVRERFGCVHGALLER
jgi:hypothetical protein